MITLEMTIEEIFSKFPQKSQKLAQEMLAAGLNCVGCGASVWETLESGMASHGYEKEEMKVLVDKLNKILAETSDLTTIALTKKAADKFRSILAEEGKSGWGLRFGEEAAGCSGFQYVLDYSEKATEEDEIFHSEGIEIHVEKSGVDKLRGSVIDYIDGLNGAGFKITNPNVKKSCGCGKSQNY